MKKKICQGRITSPFGVRVHPITGKASFHNGIDIACAVGTVILAPAECIVAQGYDHEIGGKTVILRDDATGDRYGFCHLSEQVIKTGRKIAKGTVFAKSGNTGASTGPHLHFSYAIGGYWKDGICKGFEYQDPTRKWEVD
jgi:murein DD-endopeptidase